MTPQQQIILDLLADGKYHCPTVELYMKDDRTRISELRQKVMRRLVQKISLGVPLPSPEAYKQMSLI